MESYGQERGQQLQDVRQETVQPTDGDANHLLGRSARRTEGCFCPGDCQALGYCPYTFDPGAFQGVGWPD
jgi:hypothetical protein